jgi:hypothetical protein
MERHASSGMGVMVNGNGNSLPWNSFDSEQQQQST